VLQDLWRVAIRPDVGASRMLFVDGSFYHTCSCSLSGQSLRIPYIIYTHTHIIYIYIYVCIYMCVCVCVCACVGGCMCVYIYCSLRGPSCGPWPQVIVRAIVLSDLRGRVGRSDLCMCMYIYMTGYFFFQARANTRLHTYSLTHTHTLSLSRTIA
jgi:hypothetical protein